jgi:putative thioredoxin
VADAAHVFDVEEADFQRRVIERSREVPVVVDFWASWCGPCHTLGPVLEGAVGHREGAVELAKVDVDRNQGLASRYGVQGIPAVKGFRDGEMVAEFVGAQPPPAVEAFLDQLVPSAADRLVAEARALLPDDRGAATVALEGALDLEPDHRDAAVSLADLVVADHPERALELVRPHLPDPEAERIAASASLAGDDGDVPTLREAVSSAPGDPGPRLRLGRALAASGEYEAAVDELLEVVRAGGDEADAAREQILDIFRIAGDPGFVTDARRRLASALY